MRSVRVKFLKTGNAKYISHLDLNRFMLKIIRCSNIPVWYSEGFNPHPYITFALPLSLGFESKYEFMDIRLDDDSFSNESVYNALKGLMPEGLQIVSCENPVMKAGDIAYAEYVIEFESISSDLISFIESFLSADVIKWEKKTKKGTYKEINLKDYIKNFSFQDSSLVLTLAAGGSNNLNPKLILDAFEKSNLLTLPFYNVTRTMLFDINLDAFK